MMSTTRRNVDIARERLGRSRKAPSALGRPVLGLGLDGDQGPERRQREHNRGVGDGHLDAPVALGKP